MSKATQPELGWEVLAQPTGEVLTAEARSPGLLLGLLGVPSGFEAGDAEGWLYDVAGVSHEASATRPVARPIPAILDHAVTGLLFSHAELWDQPGAPSPCSFAFVEGRGEVGFGWVGEAKVSVWVDGRLRESGFVTLHDGRGRLGRAWSIPSHHNVQVRISWSGGDPCAGGAEVEASWIVDNGSAPGYHPVPRHVGVIEEGPVNLVVAPPAPEHVAVIEVDSAAAVEVDVDIAVPEPPHAEAVQDLPEIVPPPEVEGPSATAEAPEAIVVPHATVEVPVAIGPVAAVEAPEAIEVIGPHAAVEATVVETGEVDTQTAPRPRGFGAWLRRTFGWLGGRRQSEEELEDQVWREAAGLGADGAPGAASAPVSGHASLESQPPVVSEPHVVPSGIEGAEALAPVAEDGESPAAAIPPTRFDGEISGHPAATDVGDLIPPTPEVHAESVPAMPGDDEELIPPTPEDYEELIPPSPEEAVGDEASPGSAPAGEVEAVGIPPTPEPLELTERAMGWDDDPRGIDLSSAAPRHSHASFDDFTRPRDDLDLGYEPPAPEKPVAAEPIDAAPVDDADEAWPAADVAPAAALAEPLAPAASLAEPVATPAGGDHAGVAERLARVQAAMPGPAPGDASSAAAESLPPAWAAVSPQRPAWPSREELARGRGPSLPRRGWLWIVLVAVLFAGGWMVGSIHDDGRPRDAARRGAFGEALRAIGLGGPRFLVQVSSRPPGAWVTVDGEPLSLRTPAAIEMTPGEHSVGLSFSEYGGATFPVRGRKGDRVAIDPTLWGALEVAAPDDFGVIAVKVDGIMRGLAPVRVDSLAPGVHEVRFSAAGMEPWGQTVEIRVGESQELLARAVQSPSSGVLQVQASFTDESGTQPLRGAQVWIDGELRGTTPLILDLPRGPHSVRLAYRGQEAPIQVIDLPGGNQRFAVFELGLEGETPRLTVDVPGRIPRDRPAVLSANVLGIPAGEVREMWLHVRMPEGAWRRYAMTLLKAPAGAAGVATFPTAAFDAQGRGRYYVSAQTRQGDETFTEIRTIALEAPGR